jgi:hypothetical protein
MSIKEIKDLHDAHLIGIQYLANREIRLDFTRVDSSEASIRLTGVVNFFCNGMLEGNTILSVEVLDADDISADDVAHFVKNEARGQQASQLDKIIQEKKLCMLLLSPSYGAELACVCSAVSES